MFLCRTLFLMIFPLMLSCAGGNAPLWRPYTFDGANFSPPTDTISPAIWTRSGHFPTISAADQGPARSDRLSAGVGAVAGICYSQSSGGKVSSRTSFSAYPYEQITFSNKTGVIAVVRADINGMFSERLTAGSYELFCRGVRAQFSVTQGETTLVPIRGGKRMAD